MTNGYTFYELKKSGVEESSATGIGVDGQMNTFFSNLEIRRNFGRYEVGGKIQFFDEAFISPFVKINMAKNRSRTGVIPYVTLGVVPAQLTGVYARLGLDLRVNSYFAISPFLGVFSWYKIKNAPYERYNVHVHGGLSTTLYF